MKTFVFQGDSITDAGRDRNNNAFLGNGYPTITAAKLGFEHPGKFSFINRGVSGDRIVDIQARIKKDIINLKPDFLTVLIGVNDVWHELNGNYNGVDNEKYFRVYCDVIEEVKRMCPGVKIFILEPFVLKGSATADSMYAFTTEVKKRGESAKKVAEKYGCSFLPLQDKFDSACAKAAPDFWLMDGVHPTAAGHYIIAKEVLRAVENIL